MAREFSEIWSTGDPSPADRILAEDVKSSDVIFASSGTQGREDWKQMIHGVFKVRLPVFVYVLASCGHKMPATGRIAVTLCILNPTGPIFKHAMAPEHGCRAHQGFPLRNVSGSFMDTGIGGFKDTFDGINICVTSSCLLMCRAGSPAIESVMNFMNLVGPQCHFCQRQLQALEGLSNRIRLLRHASLPAVLQMLPHEASAYLSLPDS